MEPSLVIENLAEIPLPDDRIRMSSYYSEHLPFQDVDWTTFEILVARLFHELYGEARRYKKEGAKQEGIDILAKKTNGADYTTSASNVYIQCKHVEKFSPANLGSAIQSFLKGKFAKQHSTFIICLAKPMQDYRGIEDEYDKQKTILKGLGHDFELWDAIRIEDALKGKPQIVYDIFDRDKDAKWTHKFCGEALANSIIKRYLPFPPKTSDPVPNYMKRSAYYYPYQVAKEDRFSIYDRIRDNLYEIVADQVFKRIQLISVAGAGKSAELQQLEYQLCNGDSGQYPIRIPLNNYTDEGFEEYITSFEPNFKSYDHSRVVLLLDGYDEVPSDKLDSMLRKLNTFANDKGKYRHLQIVLTSRSNFHSDKFEGFKTLYLDEVHEKEIDAYIRMSLGSRAVQFKNIVRKRKLTYLLSNAFNLVQFVKIFENSRASSFPANKAEAFMRIIDIKLEEDALRTKTLPLKLGEYRQDLAASAELLAFSMEQLGRNKVSEDEFKAIIPDGHIQELLKHSFLVNKNVVGLNEWQFEHNNFQEFLAAKVLSRLSIDRIKDFIAFGPDYSKTKPRWVNTISLLFSILHPNDKLYTPLLDWLISIEPEAIVKFESGLISPERRIEIACSVFEHYKSKGVIIYGENIRIEDLATFAGDDKDFVHYLLDEVEKRESDAHLDNILVTLKYVQNLHGSNNQFRQLLLAILKEQIWSPHTVAAAIQCLSTHGFTDRETIRLVISECVHLQHHYVRNPIYECLLQSKLVDEHIGFILDGILVCSVDGKNKGMSHSTWNIIACIHACVKPDAIKTVLNFVIKHYDREFAENSYDSYHDTKLITDGFIQNCVNAYNGDESIYNTMVELVICVDKRHEREKAKILRSFFIHTKTSLKAFQELVPMYLGGEKSWVFADVVTVDCLDFIIESYLKGIFDKGLVWAIIAGLSYKGEKDLKEDLFYKINAVTDNSFQYDPPHDQEAIDARQHEGDLAVLKSQELFMQAIEEIYSSFGKEKLSMGDLFSWRRKRFSEEGLPHKAPLTLLQDLCRKNAPLKLSQAQAHINREGAWEWFVTGYLIDMLDNGKHVDEWHKEYLVGWCMETLGKCNFEAAVYSKDGTDYYTPLEHRFAVIWQHLNFPLDENIIVDLLQCDFSGIRIHQEQDKSTPKTLSDYIVERVHDISLLERKILGILGDSKITKDVKGTLIRQCGRLHLTSAIHNVYEAMLNQELNDWQMYYAFQIYLELGGNKAKLLNILENANLSHFWHWELVKALKDDHYEKTAAYVRKFWSADKIVSEYQLEAMVLLINGGDEKAWKSLISWIKTKRSLPYDFKRTINLGKLPYKLTLEDSFSLLQAFLEEGTFTEHSRREDGLIDLIWQVALGSEEGFNTSMRLFDETIEKYISTVPNVISLRYTQLRLERTYYLNKGDQITLKEVLENNKLLNQVVAA